MSTKRDPASRLLRLREHLHDAGHVDLLRSSDVSSLALALEAGGWDAVAWRRIRRDLTVLVSGEHGERFAARALSVASALIRARPRRSKSDGRD